MKNVLCVGSITTDIILKPVDTFPEPGKIQYIDSASMFVGGCASNAAIDLARLGVPTCLSGKVGRDIFGDFVRRTVSEEGVDVSGLVTDDTVQTTASILPVTSDGERSALFYCGSSSEFTDTYVDDKLLEWADVVFIAGALFTHKLDGEPAARLMKKAQNMGKYTVMDTAFDPTGRWMSAIAPTLPYLDLFMPSYDEAKFISGKDEVSEMAELFRSYGTKNVIIKCGGDGAYVLEEGAEEGYFSPAFKVTPVDTTGAGDSFCAGFITGLTMGLPFRECARLANAVGAHCVTEIGASTGIKPLPEIYKFMEEYESRENS